MDLRIKGYKNDMEKDARLDIEKNLPLRWGGEEKETGYAQEQLKNLGD